MPRLSVSITKSGRSDEFGNALVAGKSYDLDSWYAQALVSQGFGTILGSASTQTDPTTSGVSASRGWRGATPSTPTYNGLTTTQAQMLMPALARTRNAMAALNAGTADMKIAFLGDSTWAGAYAAGLQWTGARALSAPVEFARLMGIYVPTTADSSFGIGSTDSTTVAAGYDARIRPGSNWTVTGSSWLGGTMIRNDTNAVSALNYDFTNTFNAVDIYTLQSPGGASVAVSADGGVTTLTTIATAGSLAILKTTVAVPAGGRTLTLTRQAGTGACPIAGVDAYNTAYRRVRVYNWGSGGATIATWTDNTNVYNIFPGILAVAPQLVFINIGINDAIGGTVPATFITAYQTLIDQCKTAGADVVVCIPTPIDTSQASAATQFGLYSLLRDLAQKNGAPIVDMNALYGNYTVGVASGYFLPANDLVHPGANGYAAMARLCLGVQGVH